MKYLIAVKTMPGCTLDEDAILALRVKAQKAMPCAEVWKASVEDPLEDAFIDSQTLSQEIADRKIDVQDFIVYCEFRRISAYDESRNIMPTSAQRFLISLWGQGVFVVALPLEEAAASKTFARLIGFARQHKLQLLSMAPGGGTIDMQEPPTLPPMWDNW